MAAAILFESWKTDTPSFQTTNKLKNIEKYEAGSFYKRELPSLISVIEKLPVKPEVFIIDGYCYLSKSGEPGLGARLVEHLNDCPTIIGVAKNRFKNSNHATEIYRGGSTRPLFITSIGIPQVEAAEHIQDMHGKHRIPTQLKAVDTLCRNAARL